MLLGGTSALMAGVLLQPTIYWKNAKAQRLPFTANPMLIYRGVSAALASEVVQMSLQFGSTGFFRQLFGEKLNGCQELFSASLGGCVAACATTPIELVMVQQQRFAGSMIGTSIRVARIYGVTGRGLMRGLLPTVARDSIYTTGLLGVTPVFQSHLQETHGFTVVSAGFWASMVGGMLTTVLSHPFDCIKTCMQGDLDQKTYSSVSRTIHTIWAEGGISRLFDGCFWRTMNICLTIWIANECRQRLPKLMFGEDDSRSTNDC